MLRLLLLLLSTLLLAHFISGCATTPPSKSPSQEVVPKRDPPEQLMQAMEQLTRMPANQRAPQAIYWASIYLSWGRIDDADSLLSLYPASELEADLRLEWVLVATQAKLARQEPEAALALLDSGRLDIPRLADQASGLLRNRYQLLYADAQMLAGNLEDSLRRRIRINPHLESEKRNYNEQLTWVLLMNLRQSQLETLNQSPQDTLRGWAELAKLYRDPLSDIDEQSNQLGEWELRWLGHPAEQRPPAMVEALRQAFYQRPQNVAVLLPISGPLGAVGNAVLDGILAAYYFSFHQGHRVPLMTIHDSSHGDIQSLYQHAVDQGAEVVIGPLDRNQVEKLTEYNPLPVPTLALNYTDAKPPENLLQFGLAPEDEARQVARQSWQEGERLAAVFYPPTDWGKRVADAFMDEWESLGGIISVQGSYAEDPGGNVRAMLGINQSRARSREISRFTGDLEFQPRRRQDIDFLFLVANPEQARQVKPSLNFHFASDLPVRATSHIYSGHPDPGRDNDLNGIRFVDLPWLLDDSTRLHQAASRVWPQGHGRFERLFALGVDAYRLQTRLGLLQQVQSSQLPGATGQLQLDQQGRIQRELDWAIFRHGRPSRIAVVIDGFPMVKTKPQEEKPFVR